MIHAEVNTKGVITQLKNFDRKIKDSVPKALYDTGFELMRLSQKQVPHDEGTLQNSGVVEPVRNDVVVGYHTKYAARLHEHPEYRFQKGRKGKYLEDPIRDNEQVLGLNFGKGLQRRLF